MIICCNSEKFGAKKGYIVREGLLQHDIFVNFYVHRIYFFILVSVMSEPDAVHRTDREVKDSSRMSLHTPTFNIDAYIKKTVNTLPQTMDRIIQLR